MIDLLISGFVLGLGDGILNPCTLSVLMFLFLYLLSINAKKRILSCGISFSLGVSLIYFIFLLALLQIFKFFLGIFLKEVFVVLGIISIIMGGLNLYEGFSFGKSPLRIPEKAKGNLEKYIHSGTIISSFILGFLVGFAEIPCAGMFPLAYVALLTKAKLPFYATLLFVLYYLFFFITPLMVLSLFFHYSTKRKAIKNLFEKNKRLLRTISGIILLALGIYFLVV